MEMVELVAADAVRVVELVLDVVEVAELVLEIAELVELGVDDVVKVNLWFLQHPDQSGVFNVGTGESRSFNDIANNLIRYHGSGNIEYIPFPDDLKKAYQPFTEADISTLRQVGYDAQFDSLEAGLKKYYEWYCQKIC